MNTIGISIDIETIGGTVGEHPMIQLGAVAYNLSTEKEVGRFNRCISHSGYKLEEVTVSWWMSDPNRKKTYENILVKSEDPTVVMEDFVKWLELFPNNRQYFAFPASFDWAFVKYYAWKYANCDVGYFCHDICSYYRGVFGCKDFGDKKIGKKMKELMGSDEKLAHDAVYDAQKQMELFFRIRRAIKN